MAYATNYSHPSLDDSTSELFDELAGTSDEAKRHLLCDQIITHAVPLADRLAKRFRNRGIDADDLQQVARAALVAATRRFDGSGQTEFMGYVIPCIRGEIKRHFRDAGWMIRPPRSLQEARQVAARATEDLRMKLGREPDLEELSQESGLEPASIQAVAKVQNCFSPESLDTPMATDGTSDTKGASVPELESGFDQAEARAMLQPLLKRLEPRDRKIVALRFVGGLTQQEVGRRIGISQMQVSREEKRILSRLRDSLLAA